MLTLGKNLCICPRGGLTATLSPHRPVRWGGVPSVRYHFVRSAALPTGLALLYRVRWRIVSISSNDGDHFPVGTLHPWFNLKTFHSVNPGVVVIFDPKIYPQCIFGGIFRTFQKNDR